MEQQQQQQAAPSAFFDGSQNRESFPSSSLVRFPSSERQHGNEPLSKDGAQTATGAREAATQGAAADADLLQPAAATAHAAAAAQPPAATTDTAAAAGTAPDAAPMDASPTGNAVAAAPLPPPGTSAGAGPDANDAVVPTAAAAMQTANGVAAAAAAPAAMEVRDADVSAAEPQLGWPGFERTAVVQTILNQNKLLINEINANHTESEAEGLARNQVLIQELNSNLAKVVEVYKEIGDSFEAHAAATLATAAPSAGA